MVARAWGERVDAKKWRPETRGIAAKSDAGSSRGAGRIEEMFVQNDAVSLCLLINRRAKTMRVIDFRAGPSHAKRIFVLKLAKREGIEKVYTLVERDEVSTWMKLGFSKEANIPGFYKRSDAFLLGTSAESAALTENDLRAALEDDDELEDEPSPAHDRMEKTLAQAKKQVKALLDRQLPPAKLAQVKEAEIQKTLEKELRAGRALTAFEPFGRDVERRYFQLTARGGFELVASTESQSCFGNTFLELLTAPSTEHERLATIGALRTICDKLLAEGVVSCFALAPSDDVALATAFVFNGFRRTGLLVDHMLVGGKRKDAIVWSRKLANPTET
ncbi:MAG: hypothetical protein KIS78_14095 [Labilithrix sp.]|nr:hypothetical protein [Labilithrix sp.]MCW5833529.1 hypothetical protein [Labilithrix sp.]